MKPTYWTKERVLETAKKYPSPFKLKKAEPVAYKKLRGFGLVEQVYPKAERTRRQPYSIEELTSIAKACGGRSNTQLTNPAAYNAMSRLKLLDKLFPPAQNKKKWDLGTLKAEANKYKTRAELYDKSPGAHSVACKLGLLDQLGLPKLQGTSIAELEMTQWLLTLSNDFRTKRFANDYELDAYSENLKIGIEYNGHFWHSEDNRAKDYHIDKTKYFQDKGIRVIHVWEYEWRDRQEQVKDFIRSACGKNSIKIGARKCEFKVIDKKRGNEFLDKAHIQGATNHTTLSIGCFYKDALVGVCTFGTHHRTNAEIVLNRFACLPNHTIAGFLAKASKLALEHYKQPIYSWAHITKSQASGYLKAGWTVVDVSKPDYFYSNANGEYISKQSRRKKAVNTPDGMTESQHAKLDGLYRIWDCGKIKLKYP